MTNPAPPAWIAQAKELLDDIPGPHQEKKKATIIALVDARIAGRPDESVWGLPGVCSRYIFHTKWKKDPKFSRALNEIKEAALAHKNGRAAAALALAAENLALSSPAAVAILVQLLQSAEESMRHKAAIAVLDRADVLTATKSRAEMVGAGGGAIQIEQARRRALEKAYGEPGDEEDEDDYDDEADSEEPDEEEEE